MNEEIKCKTHPDAPHGFVRNASHTEDRYVCECEYWEEPKVNERIEKLADEAEEYASQNATGDSELLGKKQHQWVSLTDEEIKKILGFWSGERRITAYTRLLFDKIDEVLKRKNT